MKQLEMNFNKKKLKPWEEHGFKTKQEWDKAKAFDRAFRHYEQSNKGVKNV